MYTSKPKIKRKHIKSSRKPIPLPIAGNILKLLASNLETTGNAIGIQEKYDMLEMELKRVENKCRVKNEIADKIGPEARKLMIQRQSLYEDRKSNKKKIANISNIINLQIRKHRQNRRNDTINHYIGKSGGVKIAMELYTNRTEILEVATYYYRELYSDETKIDRNHPLIENTISSNEEIQVY
ncbi:jg13503 [Pararge aegeria aegeria]|uniref:Jg13503 protein n=1 Tax=Pararge aegeria aegeria TaxID=348720 RepID=A0A8S4QXL1_9NEOP|nr:jg13503 [Pararge aegeria aegeria]